MKELDACSGNHRWWVILKEKPSIRYLAVGREEANAYIYARGRHRGNFEGLQYEDFEFEKIDSNFSFRPVPKAAL